MYRGFVEYVSGSFETDDEGGFVAYWIVWMPGEDMATTDYTLAESRSVSFWLGAEG